MRHETHEVIGTLCRYVLLGLTGIGVIILSAVVLSGVAQGTFDPQPLVVVPDHVTSPRQRAYPRAWLIEPQSSAGGGLLVVSSESADRPSLAISRRPMMFLPTRATALGPIRMDLRGFPYGPLALVCRQATIQVIPPSRPVVLVDAGLVASEDAEMWTETSRELHRRGAVVYLHLDSLETYQETVEALRRRDPQATVFGWQTEKDNRLRIVLRAVGSLGKRRSGGTALVTADRDLAWTAVRRGLEVRLLGAKEGDRLPENLKVFPDLRMFKESLAATAIGQ
jgi:hypothetical protein